MKQEDAVFEVICIDDGSTDSSLDILKEYASRDSKVKVFTKANGGLSDARNYGIKKASGKYIYCLDSDDMICGEKDLAFMVKEMRENDLDILYFDGESIFESDDLYQNNKFFESGYERKKEYGFYDCGQDFFADLLNNKDYFVNAALQCLRKSFINEKQLEFPVGLLYEDNLYKFESLLVAGKVKHVKKTVYIHRVRENSITTEEKNFAHFYSYWQVYKRMNAFWKDKESEVRYPKQVENVLNKIAGNAVNSFNGLSKKEKCLEEVSTSEAQEIRAFLDAFEINKEDKIMVSRLTNNTLEEVSKRGSKLIIYGAGAVGNVCIEYLLSQNINVEAVAVTDIEENPVHLWGKRIYCIDDIIEKYNDYIILICVLEKRQKSIERLLLEKGINKDNIYAMTDVLYQEWKVLNSKKAGLNKELSYYKRYTQPYIQTLNKICRERNLSKSEARAFVELETDILESNEVCMPRLVVVLSTKCSLRCKECNNLIPYFKPQEDLDIEQIIRSLETITESVGKLLKCELIGGEPFLAKNLEQALEYAIINKKIESVEITTNGTVIPRGSLLKMLQNPKVLVRISDYGTLVDKTKITDYLCKNGISYEILETGQWISTGGVEKRNKNIETLMQEYARCTPGYICKTLYEDRIFACARAASLYALGHMKEPESVHLNENFKPEYLKKFMLREFSIACDYCDIASESKLYVEPAEQLK